MDFIWKTSKIINLFQPINPEMIQNFWTFLKKFGLVNLNKSQKIYIILARLNADTNAFPR